ncbi:alpha/beta hydrolase [Devosia ginsengisoli]|uniref:alpha/beta hydrolase n=1 Tax=Devosia ginsengisoli TaxID=400770 RepID=UPI0026EBE54C|nr:alpha/beta hydrolase [Devosia ginsengisoli]MCR6673919.1 alpha/beta hydrolase [Devosia ginsengisoli]
MKRLFLWILGIVAVLAVALFLAFRLSPWPTVLVIQYAFGKGDAASEARLVKHVPPGIVTRTDLPYGTGPTEIFDLNLPPNASTPLPVIVWVHGGAWIAGSKAGVANYLKVLSGQGYATVGVEYSTGYGTSYPTPVRQVNAALGHVSTHAAELGIDPDRIILAGDSAGAQLAAQVANIITDPAYAGQVGIEPQIDPAQLRGVLLVSGAYDMQAATVPGGDMSWFVNTVLWAYSGVKDFVEDEQFTLASVAHYVTPAFPPAYITSGNGDPLSPQAERLAASLSGMGVPVSSLFYPADHAPALPHEYQFNLDTPEGMASLDKMLAFLRTTLASSSR